MRHLLLELEGILAAGEPVAYTALVETRGSTPQKPGAAMLVFPDGSQSGTLGGGCVEAEVKRRALRLLDEGQRELLTFQLDNDYGWDDGLICGGRMRMVVDPIRPGTESDYFRTFREHLIAGHGCTEAVILDAEKAGGGRESDRFLLDANGGLVCSRSDAEMPASVADNLRSLETRPHPYVVQGVSYLPQLDRWRLLIVGGGHIGQKVAELAASVDFDVWVVDDREEFCNPERFPDAKRLLVGPIDTTLSGLEVGADTMALIVTRGHNHDEEALYHLAETNASYVGMIGSRRKIKLIYEDLLREGIARESLARVHAPVGFEIGSQTVPEIAVSIVAELIGHRNLDEFQTPRSKGPVIEDVAEDAVAPE